MEAIIVAIIITSMIMLGSSRMFHVRKINYIFYLYSEFEKEREEYINIEKICEEKCGQIDKILKKQKLTNLDISNLAEYNARKVILNGWLENHSGVKKYSTKLDNIAYNYAIAIFAKNYTKGDGN